MPQVIAVIAAIVAVALFLQYWYVTIPAVLFIIAAIAAPSVVRNIRKKRYFASEEFQQQKAAIASVVAEHNEIADYMSEIRATGSFQIGTSSTGANAHLATFENTSKHNYRRDRNVAQYAADNVHNCSLQVVRNAASDPLKYVAKYFDVKANEETLADVEALGESISRLEAAIENLGRRENEISRAINPPPFITRYFNDEFMAEIGVELPQVTVPYPTYTFEYVSAGGNSSQNAKVKMDTETIDAMTEYLAERIKFKKSAAGQRALMTAKFRTFIKQRDGYACRLCDVSVAAEPNLLLEVDHIVPVSRGGQSTETNLQTLCWRCNRSKSNKLPA